jgi:hypothetical protein
VHDQRALLVHGDGGLEPRAPGVQPAFGLRPRGPPTTDRYYQSFLGSVSNLQIQQCHQGML